MRTLLQDLRYAVRQLRKDPGFALLVILTLGLGIGANTAIFSVVNGYLRPLPVAHPERLVVLSARTKGDLTGFQYKFSYPAMQDYREQADRFSGLAAHWTWIGGFSGDGAKPVQFLYSVVSGNYFSVLGLRPAVGRFFVPGEGEAPGSASNIILGYTFWRKHFSGDPGVVGKQVRVDGRPATVIGVVPEAFHGMFAGTEMEGYLPLDSVSSMENRDLHALYTDRSLRDLTLFGRLRPGVTLTQAQASAETVQRRLASLYPAIERGIDVEVVPETLARPEPLRYLVALIPRIRLFLLALAGLVLLLACLNVANVLMVRAVVRKREMAIRAALGSSRSRLVRQTMTECLLLALLGAAAGVVMGQVGGDGFIASINAATDFPIAVDSNFDWSVFLYAMGAAALTALAIGAWPALRSSRANAASALHDGDRGSGGPQRQYFRSLMVVAQVAGSLILLISAGLFARSLQNAQRINLGFDAARVLNVRLDPHQIGYNAARTRDFYRELERRARALPGVESVTTAYSAPMGYYNDGSFVLLEDKAQPPGEQPPVVGSNSVGPQYFQTMGIPILSGRAFRETDTEATPRVVIVNQAMAQRYWPGENPIGKRFARRQGGPLWEVVGMARDSKYLAVFEGSLPYAYFPSDQSFNSMRVLQIRTQARPETLAGPLQREIQALDPDMPIADLQSMKQALAGGFGFLMFRLGALQGGALGLLGLILAVIGIYGVISYGAAQRTREIGIRMALGADPRDVRALVLGQGLRLVMLGVATGLFGAWAMARVAARFVLLADANDPAAFGGVTLLLAAVALGACYLPARRAMRVEPVIALRHE